MGVTYATIKIYNKDKSKSKDILLLVDTGSTYTWIHESTLKELGIVPEKKWKFSTIENKIIEREIGEAVFEYEEQSATRIVVFAHENDAEVLGVDALEGLRYEVDPITKKLTKTDVLLAV